jgi:hypothetical protein
MTFRRIVVALAAPGETAAMTTAVELARTLNADLLGLFIENAELIALAALPFAGEVGFPSSARRSLDVEAMERGLRAQARRVERELAALVADSPVKWRFDTVRGRLAVELLAVAGETDLAVVSLPQTAGSTPTTPGRAMRAYRGAMVPVLLVGERTQQPGSIAVVPPPGSDPIALAATVAALAPRYGPSALFVEIGPPQPGREPGERTLVKLLATRDVKGRFRQIAGPFELMPLLMAEPSRLVVALATTPEASELVLDVLTCPVLVLPPGPGRRRSTE